MLCIEEIGVWCVQCIEMVGQVVRAGTGRQVALYKYIHGTEGIDPLWGGGGLLLWNRRDGRRHPIVVM